MEIPVYSMAGQVVGQIAVDEAALGGRPNMHLIRQAVIAYEANQRLGTAKTKTRGELSRSDRKPWRQKHTGRARHGTRNSPLWVGGGVSHGPVPREHRQKMNKVARRGALCSAFLAKALDGQVLAVEAFQLPAAKTRQMAAVLRNLGVARSFLMVLEEHDPLLWQCTRNIEGSAMTTSGELNAYEMIRPEKVIFSRKAIERFLKAVATTPGEQAGEGQNG
jgi:large subunit ribosomal protein L4